MLRKDDRVYALATQDGDDMTGDYSVIVTDNKGKVTFQAEYKYSEGDCGAGTCGQAYANDLKQLENATWSNDQPEIVVFRLPNDDVRRGENAGDVYYGKKSFALIQL